MPKLLTVLTDLLFPPSPDALRVKHTTPKQIILCYEPGRYNKVTCLARYDNPLIQSALKENKFYHNPHAAQLLGTLLRQWSLTNDPRVAYLPIPLGPKRLRERGHNQVVTLLHAAGLGSQTVTTLLERQIETLPQSHLSKKDRAENIQHAFVYRGNKEWWQAYDRVILIDDVVTTGATLMAARAALAPHLSPHLKLDCVALAH